MTQKQATNKAKEVFKYLEDLLFKQEDGEFTGDVLDKVALEFNGENCNTGGNCMVVYIPLNSKYFIGVTEESVVVYKSKKTIKTWEDACSDAFDGCGENEDVAFFVNDAFGQ
jgi:hypothetical protein